MLDYADSRSIQAGWHQALVITGGQLDVLFNNGAYALAGAVEDIPVAGLRENFEANFFGWHELSCLALQVMRRQNFGRILINSSVHKLRLCAFVAKASIMQPNLPLKAGQTPCGWSWPIRR